MSCNCTVDKNGNLVPCEDCIKKEKRENEGRIQADINIEYEIDILL